MKKVISIFLAVLSLAFFSFYVFADNETASVVSGDGIFYEDQESGVSFTVPAGWTETPLSKARQFIDVKYTNDSNRDLMLMFGATDLWEAVPSSYKVGKSRSDYNDNTFSVNDLGDILQIIDTKNIIEKEFNGIHFYIFDTTQEQQVMGMTITINTTHAFHMENGWAYWFQLTHTNSDDVTEELEKIVETVSINNAAYADAGAVLSQKETEESEPKTPEYTAGYEKYDESFNFKPIIYIVLIVCIILAFSFYKKNKYKVKTGDKAGPEDAAINFCHKCGMKIKDDCLFCPRCGTRIVRNKSEEDKI